jgi:hypothetical protein
LIAIDRRGSCRFTLCLGAWAIKFARDATGRRCNRFEIELWNRATAVRRAMLCPILMGFPFGLGVVMQRAKSITEDEAQQLMDADAFPDWDYMPPEDEGCPFEYKASDWGRLPDGRLVALDYSSNALSDPVELESAVRQALRDWDANVETMEKPRPHSRQKSLNRFGASAV